MTTDTVLYNDPPYRFEAGTPPIAEAAALTAALDYIDSIGKDRIRAHEDESAPLCRGAAEADEFA